MCNCLDKYLLDSNVLYKNSLDSREDTQSIMQFYNLKTIHTRILNIDLSKAFVIVDENILF